MHQCKPLPSILRSFSTGGRAARLAVFRIEKRVESDPIPNAATCRSDALHCHMRNVMQFRVVQTPKGLPLFLHRLPNCAKVAGVSWECLRAEGYDRATKIGSDEGRELGNLSVQRPATLSILTSILNRVLCHARVSEFLGQQTRYGQVGIGEGYTSSTALAFCSFSLEVPRAHLRRRSVIEPREITR